LLGASGDASFAILSTTRQHTRQRDTTAMQARMYVAANSARATMA
jgi:hypothetical protein